MKPRKVVLVIISLLCLNLYGRNKYTYQDLSKIQVDFYYNNPSFYPDVGRSIDDILQGSYEVRKSFFYEDLKEFYPLEKIINTKPEFVNNDEKETLANSFVTCLCVVKIDSKQILLFTYKDSNDDYCIYNRKLIKRNPVFDNFARFLINKL